jgi:hypothetical protein
MTKRPHKSSSSYLRAFWSKSQEKMPFRIVTTKQRPTGEERRTRSAAAPILAGSSSSRPHSFLDGDEAVLDAGAQGEVTILVPEIAHGREDDDEAPGVMGEIGTEAARLGDRFPRRARRVRQLEHGCDVVVVVKARGQHVVEAVGAD